jgi:hypothetical protein
VRAGRAETLTLVLGSNLQVPRLTTMLRTYTTDRAAFDVDAAYVARAAALASKPPSTKPPATAGNSPLARRLLPAWDLGEAHPPSSVMVLPLPADALLLTCRRSSNPKASCSLSRRSGK